MEFCDLLILGGGVCFAIVLAGLLLLGAVVWLAGRKKSGPRRRPPKTHYLPVW